MRSTRLAVLEPVTHEVTARSAVQVVLMPATFEGIIYSGYDRPRWQLFVYSWLGREDTVHLIAHLRTRLDTANIRFFLVHPNECVIFNNDYVNN